MPPSAVPDTSGEVARLALRAKLLDLLLTLELRELGLVQTFCAQVLRAYDPDVIDAFLRWRDDPRIETLMQIAACLDDDGLEQLLFDAEDIQSDSRSRHS